MKFLITILIKSFKVQATQEKGRDDSKTKKISYFIIIITLYYNSFFKLKIHHKKLKNKKRN